jgi:glycosyltransferase involved in cell wall biosynthesis
MLAARACAHLSWRLPTRIVCCAESTRRVHAGIGYDESRLVVIDNGVDTDLFRPDPLARATLRSELAVHDDTLLVGRVARLHPQKDTPSLLTAMDAVVATHPRVQLALVGPGFGVDSPDARALLATHPRLNGHIHLLGMRRDVERIYPAFDLYASSSVMEAFPLSMVEALATELPVVSTDVGDCPRIVGDCGLTVPMRRPDLLAAALTEMIGLAPEERQRMGRTARKRVISDMSLSTCIANYERIWNDAAVRPHEHAAQQGTRTEDTPTTELIDPSEPAGRLGSCGNERVARGKPMELH